MLHRTRLGLTLAALALAACGGTKDNGPADMSSTAAADLATRPGGGTPATIPVTAPADLVGTPRQLVVAAFDSLPVAGPPAALLYQANNPTIAAGQTVTVMGDAAGLSGDKYVLAVLYMQGGGSLSPKPGVDYVSAGTKTTFTGKAVTVGPLELVRLPGDM